MKMGRISDAEGTEDREERTGGGGRGLKWEGRVD